MKEMNGQKGKPLRMAVFHVVQVSVDAVVQKIPKGTGGAVCVPRLACEHETWYADCTQGAHNRR